MTRAEHIVDLLERGRLDRLTAAERARAEGHARGCASCARALEAARLADELVAARAESVLDMPPFFETRVLAALRERAGAADERSIGRMWRAARALVLGMAAAVVLLAGAAYVTQPEPPSPPSEMYTAEWRALETSESSSDDLSDEQVVAILYDSENVYGPGR